MKAAHQTLAMRGYVFHRIKIIRGECHIHNSISWSPLIDLMLNFANAPISSGNGAQTLMVTARRLHNDTMVQFAREISKRSSL